MTSVTFTVPKQKYVDTPQVITATILKTTESTGQQKREYQIKLPPKSIQLQDGVAGEMAGQAEIVWVASGKAQLVGELAFPDEEPFWGALDISDLAIFNT